MGTHVGSISPCEVDNSSMGTHGSISHCVEVDNSSMGTQSGPTCVEAGWR